MGGECLDQVVIIKFGSLTFCFVQNRQLPNKEVFKGSVRAPIGEPVLDVREVLARDHADHVIVLIDRDEVAQTHGAEQLKDT
jgi:hypothetical protein